MLEDNKFYQKILTKIKNEHLSPKPRWQFLLKNYVIWIFGGLALLLGALSFSLITNLYISSNLDVALGASKDAGEIIMVVVPFFWIICLTIFIGLIYLNIKHTAKGYRYSPLIIFSGAILGSVILGVGFHFIGLDQNLDDLLSKKAPLYDRVMNPHIRFWSNPGKGRLSGMVISDEVQNKFIIKDLDEKEWNVDFISPPELPLLPMMLRAGQPIRCLGNLISDTEFEANRILPMMSGRNRFRR
jgi:cytochrome c-type biogenesis protein CcmE